MLLKNLSELYRYRTLVSSLVARELKARYRGSVLGFFWTLLNPLLLMAVYSLVFSIYMRMNLENYAIFLFSGLLPWLWFSSSLNQGTNAIVGNRSLVTRVMFPPQVLPAVVVLANFVNFLLSLIVLPVFYIIYGARVGTALIGLPILFVCQLLLTHGLVLLVSALNVHFRDLQHIVGNLLIFAFFLTPIIYPITLIPEKYRFFARLNPLALLMSAYQDILYHNRFPQWQSIGILLGAAVLVFAVSTRVFDSFRDTFAEEI